MYSDPERRLSRSAAAAEGQNRYLVHCVRPVVVGRGRRRQVGLVCGAVVDRPALLCSALAVTAAAAAVTASAERL